MKQLPDRNLPALPGEEQPIGTSADQIAVILAPLFALFQRKIEGPTLAVYVDLLKHLPSDALEQAVRHCMETCEFLPVPATILKAHRELTAPALKENRSDITLADIAARPAWWEGGKLYRETPAERMERLARTKNWERRYAY